MTPHLNLPTEWKRALKWGAAVALAHRAALSTWMTLIWLLIGSTFPFGPDAHTAPEAAIPKLSSPSEQVIFGVWRRWDAVHYLLLASQWYTTADPCPTVFGPLTPLGFRLLDAVLPGPLDLAAMAFETTCFAIAMTFLYRLCHVYYGDEALGKWAVVITALLPLSYFFQAPMSESVYLATALGAIYFGSIDRWGAFSILTILATLTRNQGLVLIPVGMLMLMEKHIKQHDIKLLPAFKESISIGWPLIFSPIGFVILLAFRAEEGLPSLEETYRQCSYVFLVNPLEGLLTNLRWMVSNPAQAIHDPDSIALIGSAASIPIMFAWRPHRKLSMMGYTLAHFTAFISKINWAYGTHIISHTQSFARYTLVLFPITVMLADAIRQSRRDVRVAMIGGLAAGLLSLSAMHALGGGIP